jgi:hypothetical protein
MKTNGAHLLICHLRTARRKARDAAVAEVLCLIRDLGAAPAKGGPLSDRPGTFWITLPEAARDQAIARLPRLGYTAAVDLLDPIPGPTGAGHPSRGLAADVIRWRGDWFRLQRIYDDDRDALRGQAVDRRTFLLEDAGGGVRAVRGYRGSSAPTSRRGLPVIDARLLVNLVFDPALGTLVDPFAGTGGVVIEAIAGGWRCVSSDIDAALRFGLHAISGRHILANARALPLGRLSIDAVATEPPYDRQADAAVCASLHGIFEALRPGGRVAMLCAARQGPLLRREAAVLGFIPYLDVPVNRKGTDVVALAWQRPADVDSRFHVPRCGAVNGGT